VLPVSRLASLCASRRALRRRLVAAELLTWTLLANSAAFHLFSRCAMASAVKIGADVKDVTRLERIGQHSQ
jgi:hypothetical protein